MAKAPKTPDPEKMSRRKQFVQTYRMAKKTDPAIGLWIARRLRRSARVVGFVLFWLLPGAASSAWSSRSSARCSSACSPR